MNRRNQHLAIAICLGLAATGCVESDSASMEPDDSLESYPIAACADDDSRANRPGAAPIPESFRSGDYIYRGSEEAMHRFEGSGSSAIEVPIAWNLDLNEGETYTVGRNEYGFTISEGETLIAFVGATGVSPRAIDSDFSLGNEITGRLLLECDRLASWDDHCEDGYTEFLNLEIEGSGVYGAGEHNLNIDGQAYTLRVQSLMNWHPFVPGGMGCAPSGNHSYEFILEATRSYPLQACSPDDERPSRPVGEQAPFGFSNGDHTLIAITEEYLRFQRDSRIFDVPRPAVMPALSEGTMYGIVRGTLGYSIHEGDAFVAYIGVRSAGTVPDRTFRLGPARATLELDCDRVDEWYPGCAAGHTQHFNLRINGQSYGIGDHTLEVDGAAHSLSISALTQWSPAPPGAEGCAPAGELTFLFTLAPEDG